MGLSTPRNHTKNLVLAGRGDRLGARLKNALAAHDFAKQLGADFKLYWNPVDHVDPTGIPFWDLFDINLFQAVTGIEVVEEKASLALEKYGISTEPTPLELATLSRDEISALDTIFYAHADTCPPQNKYALKRLSLDFSKWPLHPKVKFCLEHVLAVAGEACWLAAHVRRGDIVQGVIDPASLYGGKGIRADSVVRNFLARYAPSATYILAIDTIYPEGKISFFSDDTEARNGLSDHFGDRSVRVDDLLSPFELSASQAALVEFCVLCRSAKLLGSKSAFVMFAAELSGAPFHDIRDFLTADVLLPDLRKMLASSTAKKKSEIEEGLIAAYARHFKKAGKFRDYKTMVGI